MKVESITGEKLSNRYSKGGLGKNTIYDDRSTDVVTDVKDSTDMVLLNVNNPSEGMIKRGSRWKES